MRGSKRLRSGENRGPNRGRLGKHAGRDVICKIRQQRVVLQNGDFPASLLLAKRAFISRRGSAVSGGPAPPSSTSATACGEFGSRR